MVTMQVTDWILLLIAFIQVITLVVLELTRLDLATAIDRALFKYVDRIRKQIDRARVVIQSQGQEAPKPPPDGTKDSLDEYLKGVGLK